MRPRQKYVYYQISLRQKNVVPWQTRFEDQARGPSLAVSADKWLAVNRVTLNTQLTIFFFFALIVSIFPFI